MNERLKEIRKELHLTQREFGRRLGVKDTAISKLENGENTVTEQMILSICREFGIVEEWFRTGIGNKKTVKDTDDIFVIIAKIYNLDSFDTKLLELYAKLPRERRMAFKELLQKLLQILENEHNNEPADKKLTLEEEADAYAALARAQFLKDNGKC